MHYQLNDPFQRVVDAAMIREQQSPDDVLASLYEDNDSFTRVLRAAYERKAERTKDLSDSYTRYLDECTRAWLMPLTFGDWIKTLDQHL